MLNGKELYEKEIITGNIPDKNVQQHGIDLNVKEIHSVIGFGEVSIKETKLPISLNVELMNDYWELDPGVYEIIFEQGCKVPADQMLLIRQRSSLSRCGCMIASSIFDAGFETNNIGTVMVVNAKVKIQKHSRIAQIYNHQASKVDNLYDGQFQNDKQRNNEED